MDSKKWEEATKKIPKKDEYELEGIKTWHISLHEMVPNSLDIHSELFREEAVKLLASGFELGFNTDHGVGYIHVADKGFIIELWQNHKKEEIHKNNLDEILDWIISFYDNDILYSNLMKKGK